ncbi:hypothetical protein [Fulvimarina sp. MAC8]|uniref:hypothetical protein n=1 Tax=Fulvimarina sp. MAC8 TaxID=3162874 RepID=UPI0032EF4578
MALGKGRKIGRIEPLAAHAGVHALLTLVVVMTAAPWLWWLAPIDFLRSFRARPDERRHLTRPRNEREAVLDGLRSRPSRPSDHPFRRCARDRKRLRIAAFRW